MRLVGASAVVNKRTGEVGATYSSAAELDGITYVKCGNRRVEVCPTCSHEYKGDAWHLLLCGLAGGKGIPESVADHPCTFATFTAPSFGPVHGLRQKGPCRARREKPVCEHGRPFWCNKRHLEGDKDLGTPLCADCYDYTAHVVWQWHAPELWRRFTITLQRDLARTCGLSVKRFRERCRISYSKVVEFQARGVIHLHVPIRLDGPDGADGPAPDLPLGTIELQNAITGAAAKVCLDSGPLSDGTVHRLRWGSHVDTRSITDTAAREGGGASRRVHPEQVAAYLAKYLTKATEDFGLPARVLSAGHAVNAGASRHAVRIIETAQVLAAEGGEAYSRLIANLATLGYRGHPITKSRAYSVTFGQIRRARRVFKTRRAGLDPDADVRELLDEDVPEGFELVSSFTFVGQGYLDSTRPRTPSDLQRWRGSQCGIDPACNDEGREGDANES